MWGVSSLNTVEALYSWFESLNDVGYFSIYRGNEKKPAERITSNTFTDIQSGWVKLLNAVSDQTAAGGVLTIYVAKHEKDTSGFTTRYSAVIQMNGMASMNGPANQSASLSGEQIEGLISRKAEKLLEEFKTQQRIDQLEQENDDLRKGRGKVKGFQGMINGLGELLENNPALTALLAPLITAITSKVIGGNNMAPVMTGPPPRKIRMQGFPQNTELPQDEENEEFEESENDEYSQEDFNRIAQCLADMSEVFDDPIEIFEKIAAYAIKNPEMAKTLLKSIS